MRQTNDYKKKKIPSNRPVKEFVSKGSKEAYKINMAIINNPPKIKNKNYNEKSK
jgi:hypothetical protein